MKKFDTPVPFYIREIKYRTLYIIISYTTSFTILFYYADAILLFETYPLNKFIEGNFVSLHILELFNSLFWLSLLNSLIIVYPLVYYHFSTFLAPGCYPFQIYLIKMYGLYLIIIFQWFKLKFYNNILPLVFHFFIYLNLNKSYIHLLGLEFKANISSYLLWVNTICNCFCLTCIIFSLFFLVLFLLVKPKKFFYFMKNYKNTCLFLSLLLFSFFIPLDPYLQIFIFLFIFLLLELIFLYSCLRFQ